MRVSINLVLTEVDREASVSVDLKVTNWRYRKVVNGSTPGGEDFVPEIIVFGVQGRSN